MTKGDKLRKKLGFDLSEYNRGHGYWAVRCSQCVVAAINGIPCHETGCPNRPGVKLLRKLTEA